ncbi:MAG: hypothetical protein LC792_01320 [Actinobacteria bacterium]|nr:hypothetical protein [Actinomycetota bacterium]
MAPDCPCCGLLMVFWSGYWRHVRLAFDPDSAAQRYLLIWVPRVRCKRCKTAPGLLPSFCLSRRLDEVEVIGLALARVVAGRPVATVAALLAVPRSTARGWTSAFLHRAVATAAAFASLAIGLGSDGFDPALEPGRRAVEAIGRAYVSARRRLSGDLPGIWRWVSVVSGGALIATNRGPP